MKLDRLVSILVILLRKERVQAKELAEMFDVSVRTILRDVEAINLAGIPIVTYQGANGGIGIAEGYRLDKSVLTEEDIAGSSYELLRTFSITGIGQKESHKHSPACRKRSPRPPKVKCGRVSMPNRLLPCRVLRNHSNRKINFSQALTFLWDH